jgi:hypothetical protein
VLWSIRKINITGTAMVWARAITSDAADPSRPWSTTTAENALDWMREMRSADVRTRSTIRLASVAD